MASQKLAPVANSVKNDIEPDKPAHVNHVHKFIYGYLFLLLLVGTVASTYAWQHNKVKSLDTKVASLQAEVSKVATSSQSQNNQSSATSSSSSQSTFTYTPHTSGLSLTLPKFYEVLVGADGNDGGAPGVSLKIVPSSSSYVASDSYFSNEVGIEVGNTFSNLNGSVLAAEDHLKQNGDCSTITQTCNTTNFAVSDTTVAGLPAKLIKADGPGEYAGDTEVYVVGLGAWNYEITATGLPGGLSGPTASSPMLTSVLSGINIKKSVD